jgi:hypothetical protein
MLHDAHTCTASTARLWYRYSLGWFGLAKRSPRWKSSRARAGLPARCSSNIYVRF